MHHIAYDQIKKGMTDEFIYKKLSLFDEIIKDWIHKVRQEIAEDTLKSFEDVGVDITEDIITAIQSFKNTS